MVYEVHIQPTFLIGGGSRKSTGTIAEQYGMKNVLLISEKYFEDIGLVDEISGVLKAAGIKPFVFIDIESEPAISDVLAAMKVAVDNDCDGVVSVGGGSVLDTAKAVAVLVTNGGHMSDFMGVGKVGKPGLPHIAIPTTSGTGSEVTRVTVITDTEKNVKMMCLDNYFMPTAAIADYELTISKPKDLTSFTGVDALTHAVEAYVSRKANPVSDIFALQAIRLISGSLLASYNDPSDERARSDMMEGSAFAGVAFSNASVGAVHGMSRPIGANFGVPHGLSNAMLLPVITEHSIDGNPARYAEIARAMGETGADETELTAALVRKLRELNKLLGVPNPETYGVDREKFMNLLPDMADAAIASGSPGNNPKVFTKEEIIDIYKIVFSA